MNKFVIGHGLWKHLIKNTNLTYNDMDTMIRTYHDSDSFKDYNPLYYMVNREQSQTFHSQGCIFNKYEYLKNVKIKPKNNRVIPQNNNKNVKKSNGKNVDSLYSLQKTTKTMLFDYLK
jgi:hypothetical protein